MKDSVAVCIVTHRLTYETIYAIENLIAKTKVKFKLYIFGIETTSFLKDYLIKLIEKKKGHIEFSDNYIKKSVALNILLKQVTEKYCVIFPINCLVHQNWLEDLIFNLKTIDKPGLISIRPKSELLHLVPILHHSPKEYEDCLKNVFLSETNAVEGLMLFDKSMVQEKAGYFNEKLIHQGCEDLEFSFRFSGQGFNNIYIRKQTLIRLNLQCDVLFPKKTKEGFAELKEEVKNMIKSQNFKR